LSTQGADICQLLSFEQFNRNDIISNLYLYVK